MVAVGCKKGTSLGEGGYGRNGGQCGGVQAARGANSNPRPGGGGYKRGMDDRDGQCSFNDMDLSAKLRRDHVVGRGGGMGPNPLFQLQ
jgi:hypothetical protein